MTYTPTPIDTTDVNLSAELMNLVEKMAANTHDVWATKRISEGWQYGKNRDDNLKTTPCLVPYETLPEVEKNYDREVVINALRLIIKLGYLIQRRDAA